MIELTGIAISFWHQTATEIAIAKKKRNRELTAAKDTRGGLFWAPRMLEKFLNTPTLVQMNHTQEGFRRLGILPVNVYFFFSMWDGGMGTRWCVEFVEGFPFRHSHRYLYIWVSYFLYIFYFWLNNCKKLKIIDKLWQLLVVGFVFDDFVCHSVILLLICGWSGGYVIPRLTWFIIEWYFPLKIIDDWTFLGTYRWFRWKVFNPVIGDGE